MATRTCSLCDAPYHSNGYCRSHLRKWKLYGDPLAPPQPRGMKPLADKCAVDGCTRKVHAKALCGTHYAQLLAHGDPRHRPPTREEIYHSSYERRGENECWPWIKNFDKNGYGKLGFKKFHTDRAHRFGWELFHQKAIPFGMLVCHTCDNPACQNPAHWFIGTNQDNMDDKVRKGRTVANPHHANDGRFTTKPSS